MGILPEVRKAGYSVREMRIVDDRGRKVGGISTEPLRRMIKDRYTSLPRGDLAATIYRTIEGRVETLFDDGISAVEEHDAGVRVSFQRGAAHNFDLVIGAATAFHHARSRLRPEGHSRSSSATTSPPSRRQAISRATSWFTSSHAKPGWQIWRFSLRDNQDAVSLRLRQRAHTGPDPAMSRSGRRCCISSSTARLGMPANPPGDGFRRGRLLRSRQPDPNGGVVERAVMLIGDAACCVSLLGGEGAGLAMTEAYVLAGELTRGTGLPRGLSPLARRAAAVHRGQAEVGPEIRLRFGPKKRVGVWFRNQVVKLMGIRLVADFFIGVPCGTISICRSTRCKNSYSQWIRPAPHSPGFVGQRLAALHHFPHVLGATYPGRLIRGFQGRRNVAVRVQVRGHVRQHVADADRLHVGRSTAHPAT